MTTEKFCVQILLGVSVRMSVLSFANSALAVEGGLGQPRIQERFWDWLCRELDPADQRRYGTTADKLNGFLGRGFGIGSVVTYSAKIAKSQLDFNARWIHDFDSSRRFEGEGLILPRASSFDRMK